MSTAAHTEAAFERLIVREMVEQVGWLGEVTDGPAQEHTGYDPQLGLYADDLVAFIAGTQPQAWEKLLALDNEPAARAGLLKRVTAQLDARGTVELLREGTSEQGVPIRLAYFEPELEMDPTARQLFESNRLRVVRQVPLGAGGGDTVDLVLFVNGLPTASVELKNRWTGQDVRHAIEQYRARPADSVLLGRRAFVHFALDAEQAFMTTRLAGKATRFLPFNRGSNGAGRPGGKGNPTPVDGGHRTAYLWRDVWEPTAWMELIEKFVFVDRPNPKAEKAGASPVTIFPRYHQWDVVRECANHARQHGAGERYLIQRSAGSGKSNEIAWLAHELSTVHGQDGETVFEKVVVITDRQVLDRQLQRQVKAFEQVPGMVEEITHDSAQLRGALEGEQARVVISTLQKFPFVLAQLAAGGTKLADRRYAVIVDEAHSSQTGDAAADLKAVLGSAAADAEPEDDQVDGVPELLRKVAARGSQPNLSFFAFTATPKPRTLDLFGTPEAGGQTKRAFHTYSMRQAVEEGFIVDVLRNYTTYEQALKIEDQAKQAVELPKDRASSALSRYVTFHPWLKEQKAEVVLDHFEGVSRGHVAGEGKAMVVTGSREEAVLWKLALDAAIKKRGSATRTLVAFSGEVKISHPESPFEGEAFTEPKLNVIDGQALPESQLPAEFDKPAYGLLVVAEKYQTGYSQSKLVAMYVDKTLTGVNTVQTLSRLNRIHPDKTETYVLDFKNDAERIRRDFEPFYDRTEALITSPNVLFDTIQRVRDHHVIADDEVTAFAAAWFVAGEPDHAALSTHTEAARGRAEELDDEGLDAFRDDLDAFVRAYGFLAQIVPYLTAEHERLHAYCRYLGARLRDDKPDGSVSVDVSLTHHRLTETGTHQLKLGDDDVEPGSAFDPAGRGARRADVPLSLLEELVALFNERFGADLTSEDAIHPTAAVIDHVDRAEPETLRAQARENAFEDFLRGKEDLVVGGVLDAGKASKDVLGGVLDDDAFRDETVRLVMRVLYDRYRAEAAQEPAALIAAGESQTVELKSTARFNLRAGEKDPRIEHAIVKTVAGFANAEGGTLLIGVDDDGSPLGLANDLALVKGGDHDGYELFLRDLLETTIGKVAASGIAISFPELDEVAVCRVQVVRSAEPVWVNPPKGERSDDFYVRSGNSTRQLTSAEAHAYLGRR